MNNTVIKLARKSALHTLTLLALALPLAAHAEQAEEPVSGGRALAVEIEAVVTAIDLESRQVSLQAPDGQIVTVAAQEKVVKLEDVSVGDVLVVNYLVAIEGEVREPTAEELAEPFIELEEAGISDDVDHPAIGAARIVRAVCTIKAIDAESASVTIEAVTGSTLELHQVEEEKLSKLEVGQQVVVVYREAIALSLEKVETPAETPAEKPAE